MSRLAEGERLIETMQVLRESWGELYPPIMDGKWSYYGKAIGV